jgi:hypothetical protein
MALDLRIGGGSLRSIAAALKVSPATIKKDLDFMYAQAAKEQTMKIEGLRAVELERLDRLHLRLWPLAVDQKTAPDYDAISQLLAISDKRAKLLGLNAKESREITMPPELLMLIRAKGLSASDLFQAMLQTLSEETAITVVTETDADDHPDDA